MSTKTAYFIIGLNATDNYDYGEGLPGCTGCGDGTGFPVNVAQARAGIMKKGAQLEETTTLARGDALPKDSYEVGCFSGDMVGGFQSRKEAQDWLNLDQGVPRPWKREADGTISGSPEFAHRYQTIFITKAWTD